MAIRAEVSTTIILAARIRHRAFRWGSLLVMCIVDDLSSKSCALSAKNSSRRHPEAVPRALRVGQYPIMAVRSVRLAAATGLTDQAEQGGFLFPFCLEQKIERDDRER